MDSNYKIIELRYIKLLYTSKDEEYIDKMIDFLDVESKRIVGFLNITGFYNKINITLYDNIDKFHEKHSEVCGWKPQEWLCGFAHGNYVETLTYSEYIKTKSHESRSLDDYYKMILHEFVHCCHCKICQKIKAAWLSEGLAIYLSKQNTTPSLEKFNSSLTDMIKGCSNYNDYITMFKFVYDKYGIDYIRKLIENGDLLLEESPKLYKELIDETVKKINKLNII